MPDRAVFTKSRGLRRVDDRRVISRIRRGLHWKDPPHGYAPQRTLYNRFVCWSRLGVFDRIFAIFVAQAGLTRALQASPKRGQLRAALDEPKAA